VALYMHIASRDRILVGTWVNAGDHIGHPSCEGGIATGTHVHIARKYNGEWVAAGDPLPFVLSGWTAHAGDAPYKGTLTKGDQTVTSSQTSTGGSLIIRKPNE
jgi:LasA protease